MSDSKSAVTEKKRETKCVPRKKRTRIVKVSAPVIQHRRSASEFSCGVDLDRALLVEESLDERERRG